MINIFLSVLLFIAIFIVILDTYLYIRTMPLSGALPIAFCIFIAVEALLLNTLSLFYLVERNIFVISHVIIILIWLGIRIGHKAVKTRIDKITTSIVHLLVVLYKCIHYRILIPLIIILVIIALSFPPNNYDTMTYHMAKVAHWIQQKSVDYYPTAIDRQNEMGPGSEYVILFFQLITNSDRFANFGQLLAYFFLILAGIHLSKTYRVRREWIPFILIIAATSPMAVMQSSSAKNDLFAALTALSIIICCSRLLIGDIRKLRISEALIIGICLGTGFIVKPTALLAAFPFIFLGILFQLGKVVLNQSLLKKICVMISVVLIAFIFVAGPDISRKISHGVKRHEVYPVSSEWNRERFINPMKMTVQNSPFISLTESAVRMVGGEEPFHNKQVFSSNEDLVGNPFQFLVILFCCAITLLISIIKYKNIHNAHPWILISLCPVFSWYTFGLFVKDQFWITRLQLPIFYLIPFSFVAISLLVNSQSKTFKILSNALIVVAYTSSAYAIVAVINNPSRPLSLSYFWGEQPKRVNAYYRNADWKSSHDLLLKTAQERQCRKIGLFLGPDDYDYPLTWRAMKEGFETKHVRFWKYGEKGKQLITTDDALEWPCIIYVGYGSIERLPRRGTEWISAGDYHTHFRNPQKVFNEAKKICLRISPEENTSGLTPLNEVEINRDSQKILLKTTGEDPFFLLPLFDARNTGKIILKTHLYSPDETKIQLYYKTKENPIFNEQQSVTHSLTKGENTVYFILPAERIIDRIRMDPGRIKGEFELYEIEIRAIDPKMT